MILFAQGTARSGPDCNNCMETVKTSIFRQHNVLVISIRTLKLKTRSSVAKRAENLRILYCCRPTFIVTLISSQLTVEKSEC